MMPVVVPSGLLDSVNLPFELRAAAKALQQAPKKSANQLGLGLGSLGWVSWVSFRLVGFWFVGWF